MNTVTDLRSELDALARHAPADDEVRQALADRIDAHARRRRTTSLIAVAAAVVLVAAGASVAGAVLAHRSAGPAGPTPVVQVPEVPLPPGTKLIRHQLRAVTTPVTATPPKGLTGQMWMSGPGRLAVSFFDPVATGDSLGWSSASPSEHADAQQQVLAGYVISDSPDQPTTFLGAGQPTRATVHSTAVRVGGHPATLDIAPAESTGAFGLPATERVVWRLPNGRWIAVWSGDRSGKPSRTAALEAFAATITNIPRTLDRTVGIGVTLPGLTVDSSMNSYPVVSYLGSTVFLCPAGVDPMATTYSSSSGSGSVGPDGSTSSSSSEQGSDPTRRCVTAAVVNVPTAQRGSFGATATVTVGDTVAHVDPTAGTAWADLGGGLTAVAGAPSAHLSAPDLAALVASVRLSPAVTVLPWTGDGLQGSVSAGTAGVVSSRATPIPSPEPGRPSSAGKAPAGVAPSASVASSAKAAESSAASVARSAMTAASSQLSSATAATVLAAYLDALQAGDCAAARRWTAGSFVRGNGELCGDVRVSAHSTPQDPAAPRPDEREFAITLTTGGSTDGSIPAGGLTWFYLMQRQPDGAWLITGGGSGP